jgi:diketogulonate reductase-like aldo/keto reductase
MNQNLQQLKLDYVDLTLVHFPVGNQAVARRLPNGDIAKDRDGKDILETVAEYDFMHVSILPPQP